MCNMETGRLKWNLTMCSPQSLLHKANKVLSENRPQFSRLPSLSSAPPSSEAWLLPVQLSLICSNYPASAGGPRISFVPIVKSSRVISGSWKAPEVAFSADQIQSRWGEEGQGEEAWRRSMTRFPGEAGDGPGSQGSLKPWSCLCA